MGSVRKISIGGSTVTLYSPESDEASTLKQKVFSGVNVRSDTFGRIILDTCNSDHEHLVLPPDGKERSSCRTILEALFQEFVGKRGTMIVTVDFKEDVGG